jgi:hypothetical protein
LNKKSFGAKAFRFGLMKDSPVIKRFLAAFFLLLFSFGVTPKRFLHDLLAHHKDAQMIGRYSPEQVAASGYHCHVDELVVMEPFLPGLESSPILILSFQPLRFCEPLQVFNPASQQQTESRGPPIDFCS